MINYREAIILSIIESITEFIPVSSTAHMIIALYLMKVTQHKFTNLFIIGIQLGAISSIIVLYTKYFFKNFFFYSKLFLAIIPIIIFGLLFSKYIDNLFNSPIIISISLLIGGLILIKIDNWTKQNTNNNLKSKITHFNAFIIGIFQCIAIIPGISRSAATSIGGMLQKIKRSTAVEFSFFLAVPTIFIAIVKKLFDYYAINYFHNIKIIDIPLYIFNMIFIIKNNISIKELKLLFFGNLITFSISILVLPFFINYINKNGFKLFGYYRIILGIIFLIIHLLY